MLKGFMLLFALIVVTLLYLHSINGEEIKQVERNLREEPTNGIFDAVINGIDSFISRIIDVARNEIKD